ncbi:Uma2 family endonuclease [Streptomyces sp. SID3343]|uniref:Uma2 family endonuclease n=1 Tax=Streptomyces sp. SID3343 TaxID=2690260 RepID=UPI00136F2AE4|nr:Uma2 family endonuclease [Streptomyces sp. SID3343]MYW05469.1 Uma2 family endonuclease [Streptomyces sp. SID3343]
MTLAVETRQRTLAEIRDDLNLPKNVRAEIIGGQIVMSPAPRLGHAGTLSLIQRQVEDACPDEYLVVQGGEIVCAVSDAVLIPDLCVVPWEAITDDLVQAPTNIVELVCEVTSKSTRRQDLADKRAIYAAESIPFYLLVDRLTASVELCSSPKKGVYRSTETVSYGELIPVPTPFGFTLDTTRFPDHRWS